MMKLGTRVVYVGRLPSILSGLYGVITEVLDEQYMVLFDSGDKHVVHRTNVLVVTPLPELLETQVGGTHYTEMKIQPIEYIHANGIGWFEGTAIKYLSRWKAKGGLADLKKAKDIIDKLIHLEEANAVQN